MIVSAFLNVVVAVLGSFFFLLPDVSTLPLGLDSALLTAVGWWNAFLGYFWPLAVIWLCFKWYPTQCQRRGNHQQLK